VHGTECAAAEPLYGTELLELARNVLHVLYTEVR
jgi:hypothetical protein